MITLLLDERTQVIVLNSAQKPLPLGDIFGDDVHIWDADLKIIDDILRDNSFIEIVAESFRRNSGGSTIRGRKRMALNRTLRIGVLKHIKNWSFRELFGELQRNLDARGFSQVFEEKIRSVSALSRNICKIDEQALREMNELLCQFAFERGIIKGNILREDTTVCESNIHYPTDSTLLSDGGRVLQRLVNSTTELLPNFPRMQDRSRSTLHRVLEINRAARGKGDVCKQRRKK